MASPVAKRSCGSLPGFNNNGGRRKDNCWDQVKQTGPGIYRCKHCSILVSAKAERIKSHLNKCSEFKKTVKDIAITNDDDGNDDNASFSIGSNCAHSNRSQENLKNYIVSTSKPEKEKLDISIAKYFYSSNTAFLQAENPNFIDMITQLRPGYTPPNRKAISDVLLNKVYEDVVSDVTATIKKAISNGMAITLCQVCNDYI